LINEYTLDAKEKLEEIPMDIVLGSIFFLYNLGIDLSKTMVDYLEAPQMDSLMQGTNFSRKYGWYQSIFTALAQNDIRRLEDITKLNVHKCLYTLEYLKEKAEMEAKRIKKNFK